MTPHPGKGKGDKDADWLEEKAKYVVWNEDRAILRRIARRLRSSSPAKGGEREAVKTLMGLWKKKWPNYTPGDSDRRFSRDIVKALSGAGLLSSGRSGGGSKDARLRLKAAGWEDGYECGQFDAKGGQNKPKANPYLGMIAALRPGRKRGRGAKMSTKERGV